MHRFFEGSQGNSWVGLETADEFTLSGYRLINDVDRRVPRMVDFESMSGVEAPAKHTSKVAEL
jgi:hypothetical protein